jgi:hypothetical protein
MTAKLRWMASIGGVVVRDPSGKINNWLPARTARAARRIIGNGASLGM